MGTLPDISSGEVRLKMTRDLKDGTTADATGYAILSPNLRPGTRYRAVAVDPIVATETYCPFVDGLLRDPETKTTWPRVLGSDAPGASIVGLQYKLTFRLDNVERQPEPIYFTVPAGGFVDVGMLAETTPQPGIVIEVSEETREAAEAAAAEATGAARKQAIIFSIIGL